jgi:DNA polymerase-4
MDAFYASVEVLDRPELRGKPVLVGSDRPRGVVAAASYEAREFGCRSAQPMGKARRLCPAAIVVPPRMARYVEMSDRVFAVLGEVSPLVEPLSIDEAFLDLTGTERLLGPPEGVARGLKDRIRAATGLTASVGVAPNKFLAKVASDLRKPDGLVVVLEEDVDRLLLPLPVERLWGVGPKTAARLHGMGYHRVADLRALPAEALRERFGEAGDHFWRLCRGLDDRPVVPAHEAKSMGQECTFESDLEDAGEVRAVLLGQAEEVAARLRRHGVRARGVQLKIRYGDYETITRAETRPEPTDATAEIARLAAGIFDRWAGAGFRPVRLVGMAAIHLEGGPRQPLLFPDTEEERQRRLDAALDEIRGRFGGTTIRRGAREAAGPLPLDPGIPPGEDAPG